MSPEKSLLQLWEDYQRDKGNIAGAQIARTLRDQFGDISAPPNLPEPEILYPRRKDVVSRFVKKAMQEGVHLRKPIIHQLSEEGWIRGKNILGSYLLSGKNQEAIGKIYGIGRISTFSYLRNSIRYLWLSASPKLQEQFILSNKTKRESRGKIDSAETSKKRGIIVPYLARGPKKRSYNVSQEIRTYKPHKPVAIPPEGNPIHPKLKEALIDVKFTFIGPKSRELLKQALAEGSHLNTPPGMNPERWINYRNIFGTYILSKATHADVGNMYGISGERVRQISEEVFNILLPHSEISIDKSINHLPPEWILVKNSLGSDIFKLLEQGLSGNQVRLQLKERFLSSEILKALKILREKGTKITKLMNVPGETLRIIEELGKDLSDGQIQSIFDQFSMYEVQNINNYNEVIIFLTDLLKSAGFHYPRWRDQQLFYDALIDADIPLGMVENIVRNGPQKGKRFYYFIATNHKERAESALK